MQRSNEAQITTPRDFFAQLIRGRNYTVLFFAFTVRPFRQSFAETHIKKTNRRNSGSWGVEFCNRMLLGQQRDYILILET